MTTLSPSFVIFSRFKNVRNKSEISQFFTDDLKIYVYLYQYPSTIREWMGILWHLWPKNFIDVKFIQSYYGFWIYIHFQLLVYLCEQYILQPKFLWRTTWFHENMEHITLIAFWRQKSSAAATARLQCKPWPCFKDCWERAL